MTLSPDEQKMYLIMYAIYVSNIPIDFKGAMVLKACLLEAGYSENIRHTADIDGNWHFDTPPSADEMTATLQNVLRERGLDYHVRLYRMYGEKRSAGFEFIEPSSGRVLFTMDVDISRPAVPVKTYEIGNFHFRGITPAQMIADKVSVVSSSKVFRRVKDVMDLYYLSQVFSFDKAAISYALIQSGRCLDSFYEFLHREADLEHAYNKYHIANDVRKPPFQDVYDAVKSFVAPVLPEYEIGRTDAPAKPRQEQARNTSAKAKRRQMER